MPRLSQIEFLRAATTPTSAPRTRRSWASPIIMPMAPNDAHPIHAARLYLAEEIVKRALEAEPEYWRDSLANVEQLSDQANPRQPKSGAPWLSL